MSESAKWHRKNDNTPGHAHELTWTCFRRDPFLSRERVCVWLADAINAAREKLNFDIWAYVFMPEHVHLIVHPRDRAYDIAAIRQAIKEPCARRAVTWLKASAPEWLPGISGEKWPANAKALLAKRWW